MTKARENSDYTGLAADITAGDTAARAGRKNLIINGGMQVSQRGSAVGTPASGGYSLDRFHATTVTGTGKFSVQQTPSTTESGYATRVAAGFNDYLAVTSLSNYAIQANDIQLITQSLEGNNVAHLGWGTSSAKTVTLSFLVRSSLTGTFGGSFRNYDNNRSFPFSYAIPVANTWTTISVTVAGDTSGTWKTDNTAGIYLSWGLGVGSTYSGSNGVWAGALDAAPSNAVSVVGTSGATFYLTGVQLETGSVATDFEHRSYGEELSLCLRYFWRDAAIEGWFFPINPSNNVYFRSEIYFPTIMRSSPSVSVDSSITGTQYITNSKVSLRLNHIASYSTWTGITVSAEL